MCLFCAGQSFRDMNVWPVAELVGYGLAHGKAPPLSGGATHLAVRIFHLNS
jgi:hypothetical protein